MRRILSTRIVSLVLALVQSRENSRRSLTQSNGKKAQLLKLNSETESPNLNVEGTEQTETGRQISHLSNEQIEAGVETEIKNDETEVGENVVNDDRHSTLLNKKKKILNPRQRRKLKLSKQGISEPTGEIAQSASNNEEGASQSHDNEEGKVGTKSRGNKKPNPRQRKKARLLKLSSSVVTGEEISADNIEKLYKLHKRSGQCSWARKR